jgi:spore coat polysaccharide biosynthesis protein SpsF (cytidylyltransferase family)
MKIGIVVQARTGSSRLPGKVLKPVIGDRTVLHCVLERVLRSRSIHTVVVATTSLPSDDGIPSIADSLGIPVFRGSERDLLRRYIGAMDAFGLEVVVRVTADCPLIEPQVIDDVVELYLQSPCDYAYADGYPRGTGEVELITYSALVREDRLVGSDAHHREHVTTFLLEHPTEFRLAIRRAPKQYVRPEFRLTVDEQLDLDVVQRVYQSFSPRTDFGLDEVIAFLDAHPEIASLNRHVKHKPWSSDGKQHHLPGSVDLPR